VTRPKKEGIGLHEVRAVVTMQVFVRGDRLGAERPALADSTCCGAFMPGRSSGLFGDRL
jgi:hypothetical protein